jgi:hypothetical protein
MVGQYFAARPDEIDEELVETGPDGRFDFVSAKTHSQVTTATLGEILGVGGTRSCWDGLRRVGMARAVSTASTLFRPRSAMRLPGRSISALLRSGGRRRTS